MPSLPDPAVLAELTNVTRELAALRASIDGHGHRLEQLVAENATLRARLASSETARSELLVETERILALLAAARHELRGLQSRSGQSNS